jgi:hypothetical protein
VRAGLKGPALARLSGMISASTFRWRRLGTSISRTVRFPEPGEPGAVTGMELQSVGIACIRGGG